MTIRVESQAEPIPGYRLLERLGGGGFGEVWKAIAPGGLHKAIKFVYGDLQTASEDGVRAEQELKALSRVKTVRHPYILSLERYDIIDGQLIIVMELADRNLWDRFRECQSQGLPGIPREELLGYMAEIAEALDLMNQEYQLQHLDIKPQNLFLVHNHIKVADFGLVKDLEGMVASVTGGVTPVYAAPETFDGWVSRFSDQYSLGIVYQELLTGKRPFSGTNVRQLILQHLQGQPDLSPLPLHDQEVIARALSKNPDDRHPLCRNMVQALQEAEGKAGGSKKGENGAVPSAEGEIPTRPTTPMEEPPEGAGAITFRIRPPSVNGEGAAADTPQKGAAGRFGGAETPGDLEELVSTPRPITKGEGALFPALLIGLGHQGREVLKRVAAHLTERFGSPLALPHVRLLYIDTDPEAARLATAGQEGESLRHGEVLLTPLHRPSHYLNPRQGKARVDTWLDTKMLYRIPRQGCAAGVRALGRLALVDNFRTITLRLRRELQECTDPAALAEAAHQTGLGLRRDQPRIYIVCGLAGGTGGGMFIDLAYVVRTLLRHMGYVFPEVVGLFLLPPADPQTTPVPALGNAYAALTELNHFSTAGTMYTATFDSKEAPVLGPVRDTEPPFQRCFFLPLHSPRENGPGRRAGAARTPSSLTLASNFLLADLTTPLGRQADQLRETGGKAEGLTAEEEKVLLAFLEGSRPDSSVATTPKGGGPPAPGPRPTPLSFTFGLHRLVWPRRALVRQTARRVCRNLVERWMSKDGRQVKARVQEWVKEQWGKQDFTPEHLITSLHEAGEKALRRPPETVLAEVIEPLAAQVGADADADLDPDAVVETLRQLEQLVGRPQEANQFTRADKALPPGKLEEVLRQAGENLAAVLAHKMAELAVCLIEEPAFRLVGAEEAIRQLTALIEQTLQNHEQFAREILEKTVAAYGGILAGLKALRKAPLAKTSAGRRGGWFGGGDKQQPSPQEVILGHLRGYVKGRYQYLVLQQVTALYVSLRGQLSDQMREVGFCRNRLHELLRSFGAPDASPGASPELDDGGIGLARALLPPGCKDVAETVDRLVEGITPADMDRLDQRIEAVIRKEFTALVEVCLGPANQLKSLERAMQQEAESALGGELARANAVDMFLSQPATAEGASPDRELGAAFEKARPALETLLRDADLNGGPGFSVLAAPAGANSEPLQELVSDSLPRGQVHFVTAPEGKTPNEILIYREAPLPALADLKLLREAREAYLQVSQVEHYTPHTRLDVGEWLAPEGGGRRAPERVS